MFRTLLAFLFVAFLLCACGMNFSKTRNADTQKKLADVIPIPAPRMVYTVAGYQGNLLVSEDLDHWTQAPVTQGPYADNNYTFRGSCVLPDALLVVGGGTPDPGEVMGRIARSTNGTDWEELKENLQWMGGCAYGNEVTVIGGGYGLARRSTDLGKTWDRIPFMRTPDSTVFVTRVVRFINGLFYLMGDGNWVGTSEDGLTYEYTKYATAMRELTYGNEMYVATFSDKLQYSSDHLNWTAVTPELTVNSLHFDGTDFRAFASGMKEYVSRDGINWTTVALPANMSRVFYMQKMFLGLAPGPKLFTSPDGVNWTDRGLQPLFQHIANGAGTVLPR